METLKYNNQYKITFNGSSTYYFEDHNGNCYKIFGTLRKAVNHFNKVSSLTGAR